LKSLHFYFTCFKNFFTFSIFAHVYQLPQYITAGFEEVFAFMQAHPFILLTCNGKNGYPHATHVPVLMEIKEEKLFLACHVMKNTDHANAIMANRDILCIFSGANSYVSASWYDKKNVGSTWNYKAVHALGSIRIYDEVELLEHLTKLTRKYETGHSGESLVENMDKNYVDKMMQAIMGIEIEINTISHVFKLSQEKSEKEFEHIQQHLFEKGNESAQVAKDMEEIKQHLFKK